MYKTIDQYEHNQPIRATAFKEKLAKELIRLMSFRENTSVLELGCGNGWLCFKIASFLNANGKVIGIDINENAVKQAEKSLSKFRFNNVDFKISDLYNLEFNETFDYVICVNSFHHFTDHMSAMKKIDDLLRSGGEVIIIDFCGDSRLMRVLDRLSIDHNELIRFLKSNELVENLRTIGFNDISVKKKRVYRVFEIMVGHAKKGD
jgi:ubiquinone/menaquinone biosynthesis C-methylase UbiE